MFLCDGNGFLNHAPLSAACSSSTQSTVTEKKIKSAHLGYKFLRLLPLVLYISLVPEPLNLALFITFSLEIYPLYPLFILLLSIICPVALPLLVIDLKSTNKVLNTIILYSFKLRYIFTKWENHTCKYTHTCQWCKF